MSLPVLNKWSCLKTFKWQKKTRRRGNLILKPQDLFSTSPALYSQCWTSEGDLQSGKNKKIRNSQKKKMKGEMMLNKKRKKKNNTSAVRNFWASPRALNNRRMQRYFKKTKCDSGMFHLECLSAFLIITSLLPLTSDTIHSSSTLFSAVPTQVACTGHHHTQKHWQIKMHWMTERTNYSLAFRWKLIIHPLIVTLSIRIWTLKSSSTVECFAEYSTNIQTKICRFLQTVLLELWWKKAWKKKVSCVPFLSKCTAHFKSSTEMQNNDGLLQDKKETGTGNVSAVTDTDT